MESLDTPAASLVGRLLELLANGCALRFLFLSSEMFEFFLGDRTEVGGAVLDLQLFVASVHDHILEPFATHYLVDERTSSLRSDTFVKDALRE